MNLTDLLARPTLHLIGFITDESLRQLTEGLQAMAAPPDEDDASPRQLTIAVTSEGGMLAYAHAMREMIRHTMDEFDTRIVVIGRCYSAAVSLLMAVPRDRRYATPGTRLMVHPATVPYEENIRLDPHRVQNPQLLQSNTVIEYAKIEELDNEELLAGTRVSRTRLHKMMEATTFFSTEEAKRWGFIGHIL